MNVPTPDHDQRSDKTSSKKRVRVPSQMYAATNYELDAYSPASSPLKLQRRSEQLQERNRSKWNTALRASGIIACRNPGPCKDVRVTVSMDASIRVGSILSTINGVSVASLGNSEIIALLSKSDAAVTYQNQVDLQQSKIQQKTF